MKQTKQEEKISKIITPIIWLLTGYGLVSMILDIRGLF